MTTATAVNNGQGVQHPSQLMAITPNASLLDDSVKFKVRDTTSTNGARTHVMLDEKGNKVNFTFPNDTDTIDVPYQHAIKFARIAEFQVFDPNGRIIRAVPQRRDNSGLHLGTDECIAKLDELTQGALLARCYNAGGQQTKNTPKEKLISFLQQMAGMRVVSAEDAAREEAEDKAREREEAEARAAVGPGNGIAANEVMLENLN